MFCVGYLLTAESTSLLEAEDIVLSNLDQSTSELCSTPTIILESTLSPDILPSTPARMSMASDELCSEIRAFCCSCKLGTKGRPCSETLSETLVLQQKLSCLELDYYNDESVNYLNEHMIAKIDAICSDSEQTRKGHSKNTDRQRVKCQFVFHGQRICQTSFLFVHNLGKKRWKNLMKRWQNTGVELHTHGNRGNGNKSPLTRNDITDMVKFVDNLAATHAMILPGRVPAFKDPDLKLLPSSLPKSKVHRLFLESAKECNVRLVSYRTFCRVWRKYRPNVRVQNPRTANQILGLCQNSMRVIS